jgi:DNA-binding NtrC family response regulator
MTSPKTDYPNAPQQYPNAELGTPTALLGAEPAFEAQLYRLAPSRVTVLLVGGTTELKRAVAQALHERSPRRQQPFVVFDCRGLASDTVELGLFGGPAHEPAAAGAIQRADAGTLYVAAIDELPLLAQPRFLRFLDQDRNARVIASTDADLVVQVERSHFRFDLAERLSLVELVLPEAL